MTQIKITYKIIVGAYCIRPKNESIANVVGAGPVPARDKSPKKEGKIQMKRYVTVGAVAHGNLINNKKINVYTIFMYFLRRKNAYKNI